MMKNVTRGRKEISALTVPMTPKILHPKPPRANPRLNEL